MIFWCYLSCYFFPDLLYRLYNFYFLYEGVFEKVGYPCILSEAEQSAEERKRQQFYRVPQDADW